MTHQPSKTLTEQAAEKISQKFPEKHTESTRVVWWDDGGYLEEIIKAAAGDLGVGFRAAEGYPLSLRAEALDEVRDDTTPSVWYIGQAKDGRDWFRDIRETGGEITCSIEELTAELYEVQPWDIFDVEREDAHSRADAADIIKTEFGSPGIPTYQTLVEEILTKGGGQILDHLLRVGWPEISREEETVRRVRERLRENHGVPISTDASPEQITDTVRQWAVAQALMDNGVSPDAFKDEFEAAGYSPLTDILELRGARTSAEQYLGDEYWIDVVNQLDDVWEAADCPVDGALDVALWESWWESLDAGDYETCVTSARRRQEALSVYPSEVSWVNVWKQAEHLARLRQYFAAWDGRDESQDPFQRYADPEDGTWRIDNEVLELQLTETPEKGLPSDHPAAVDLPNLRAEMLDERYKDYLDSMADDVETAMHVGNPLVDKKPAYEWWSDHQDDFEELGTVAVFLIDALRYDLAQQLAQRLEEQFEVKRETRLAALPSETKFGMAALTPGRSFRFSVMMEGDSLSAAQGDRTLANKRQRESFLDEEGWEVPDDIEEGWEFHHIVYSDKELDDAGEVEIGDVETRFREYVEELAEHIHRKLDQQNWDRIYVVTDHGFVLLPPDTMMESISVAAADAEVKYRRVAGDSVGDLGAGVHLTPQTGGLDYLETNLQLLVSPRAHFAKQGYDPSRYYHGGLLPQECMLSFLEIQQ